MPGAPDLQKLLKLSVKRADLTETKQQQLDEQARRNLLNRFAEHFGLGHVEGKQVLFQALPSGNSFARSHE